MKRSTWEKETDGGKRDGWAALGRACDGRYLIAWNVANAERPKSPDDVPLEWLTDPLDEAGAELFESESEARETFEYYCREFGWAA